MSEEVTNPHPIYYEPGGRKWRLTRPFYLGRKIRGMENITVIDPGNFHMEDGYLIGEEGSDWDGASFIAIDDAWNQPASFTHDKGYSAVRQAVERDGLKRKEWERLRKCVDQEFYRILIEMIPWIVANKGRVKKWLTAKGLRVRAWYFYTAVRIGGEGPMLGKPQKTMRKLASKAMVPRAFPKPQE